MKKIAIVTEWYFEYAMGGTEYQISLLAQELLKAGHELHYIFIDYGWDNKTNIDIKLYPVKVKKLSRKLGNNFFLYKNQITKCLEIIKPDIIYHRNLSAFAGIAAKYCVENNCKLIWHIANEPDVQPFRLKKARTAVFDYIDKKISEYGIQHADYIIGQANYQKELLLKNYCKKCDSIIGNWHPAPNEKYVKKLPIKVAWISNFKQQKHPKVFVELARQFQKSKNIEFIMIGRPATGEFQRSLENEINSVNKLNYIGEKPIEVVNRVLAQSQIFVNTSEYEGFPNTFVQAWMREVPVISLNVDPDDILKNEKIGFHSGSFDQLVKDTELLISDEAVRNQMGFDAKKYAEANHSIKNTQKLIDLIEK